MRITTMASFGAGALLVYLTDPARGRERRRQLALGVRESTLSAIRNARSLQAARAWRKWDKQATEITIDLASAAEALSGQPRATSTPPHRAFTRTLRQAYVLQRRSTVTPANTR